MYKAFYEPIKHLTLEQKGKLFDAIFIYQIENKEPDITSEIYIPFMFFKNQFTLDNIKYDNICERNKKNGLQPKRSQKSQSLNRHPKQADNDNDNDNEKENETVNDNVNDIELRKQSFAGKLYAYKEFNLYSDEMIKEFYDYWTEHSENGKKMRFEKESVFDIKKRLETWQKRSKNYGKQSTAQRTPSQWLKEW